jgi:sucrose phosphorylase
MTRENQTTTGRLPKSYAKALLMRHYPEPDFSRAPLEIPSEAHEKFFTRLCRLYGEAEAKKWLGELERILKVHYAYKPPEMLESERKFERINRFTERDMILITYGDLLHSEGLSPLGTLEQFIGKNLRFQEIFNTIHILPFFPYSSDRGFSITDFKAVNLSLGTWEDIEQLGEHYQLMFDGVFNHVSSRGELFQQILCGNPDAQDLAIVYSSPNELTEEQRGLILRPRTSDILTPYQSIDGPIWVWTTFSADQIDLNYKNPRVLMKVIETLLLYVRYGADLIRLDAATYLWKEPGTSCAHLPQTHELVKLFRDVLNLVAPTVALITETNVPHQDNISYFGDGEDEAQMVYNFALPPLVLHTFYREDATVLSNWAKDLIPPSQLTTFFNILDTHDGVGLLGVTKILSAEDIGQIVQTVRKHGAFISYKAGEGGKKEPYEINTTWFSALNLDNGSEEIAFQVKRFVASRSIALALRGVPGIYFHGLVGTCNDIETVRKTKSKRDINRKVLQTEELVKALAEPKSKLSEINKQLGKLLEIRVVQSAFHPSGEQQVLSLAPEIFSVLRTSPSGDQHILALTNVANRVCQIQIPLAQLGVEETNWYDLVGGRGWIAQQQELELTLQPYDVVWLIPFIELERDIER